MRILVIALLFLSGCASTLSEDKLYEREDAQILAREGFQLKRNLCEKTGGDLSIRTDGSRMKRSYTHYITGTPNASNCSVILAIQMDQRTALTYFAPRCSLIPFGCEIRF